MTAPIVRAHQCSKWYGAVLGVNDISWSLSGGVVGLLGPNGAGKSTLMKLAAGLIRPSRGTIEVFGQAPASSPDVRRRIGYSPEHESSYDDLTGREFVSFFAHIAGVPLHQANDAAVAALETMGMLGAMDRPIGGYSKGMRQRTKLAATIAHGPELLILDEPLTGVDPIARTEIIDRIRRFAADGKTVIVSSHVLFEIEALTQTILVIYRGQILADGDVHTIRRLIDHRPHRIRIVSTQPRALAAALAGAAHVTKVEVEGDTILVDTNDPDRCYDQINATVVDHQLPVSELTSPDNNLGAVFDYLTSDGNRHRARIAE
ncbi:MAG: ABC transporter ATP-binding protein [Myxococcales bacterium]|nr:ABC transporter ATP-binding protein [Myxococcales bacterium]